MAKKAAESKNFTKATASKKRLLTFKGFFQGKILFPKSSLNFLTVVFIGKKYKQCLAAP